MKIAKALRNTLAITTVAASVAFMSGCGGVNDEMMQQMNDLKAKVSSLQDQANSLKDQRAALEKEMAEKNAKLQQCNKDKEEARANLDKLPQ